MYVVKECVHEGITNRYECTVVCAGNRTCFQRGGDPTTPFIEVSTWPTATAGLLVLFLDALKCRVMVRLKMKTYEYRGC